MPTVENPEPQTAGFSNPLLTDVRLKEEVFAFPASLAQEAFFYLERLNPGTAPFNIAARFRLKGRLDVAILKHALSAVIERHEVLRTKFDIENGELVQIVLPNGSQHFEVEDLSTLDRTIQDTRLVALGRREASWDFDLSNLPLLRILLVRFNQDEHFLHITLHHAIADGWSLRILVEEMATHYAAAIKRTPCTLPPLPIQYADFALWQREFLAGPGVTPQLEYWKDKLAGYSEVDLFTDSPRPQVKKWNGDIVSRPLPPELSPRLEEIARRNGATPFQLFLGAFKILLHRYSGAHDITVGTPVAGRNRTELEPLIGTFINSVLLRTDLSGDPTFNELLQGVRDTVANALSNQDLPFERLVREIKPSRDAGRNPLFQINFTQERDFLQAVLFADIELTAMPSLSTGTIFDLHFFVTDRAGAWHISCDYCTDLFDRTTVLHMLGHFQMLIEGIAANPNVPASKLPMLSEAELYQINEWKGRTTSYPREETIGSLFVQNASLHPEKIAIIQGDRSITYGQLHAHASRLARELQAQGVKPGTMVAITAARSPEAMSGLIAIALAGGAYIPIDHNHPIERIRFLMDDAGATVLLVEQSAPPIHEDNTHHTLVLPPIGAETIPFSIDAVGLSALHPAYVLYTSGSTGEPKGVVVPHRAIIRLVCGTDYMTFGPDEVFLQAAPLSFDASTLEIWGPLLNGGKLILLETEYSGLVHIAQTVRQRGVTTLWLTAGLFQMMVDEHLDDLKGLRNLLAGGDVLPIAHVRRAFEALPHTRLINGYGPTENTTFTTCHTITAEDLTDSSISIGRPIANTTVLILDPEGQPVPIGVPGEILTGGDGLALGYLGNQELTKRKFVPNPLPGRDNEILYITGDRGRWKTDGTIEFLGRRDRQVKIRGVRVEPAEVEKAISSYPTVGGCKVGTFGSSAGNKTLVAWVSPTSGATLDRQELADYLAGRLPPFLCPDAIMILDVMPLTSSGKINAAALPDPNSDARTRSTPPVTETEKQLAAIWCELLEISTVGRDDNFFHLGGHSLMGLKLFSRILRDFDVPLPLAVLLKAPTLRSLAIVIEVEMAAKEPSPGGAERGVLATIQRDGHLTPFFCVHGGDGGIIFYRNLAIHLNHDRPLVAIESPALRSFTEIPQERVEDTAKEYLKLIRKRQSRGPYLLGGYSYGGAVAYEMARLLIQEGEEVAFLALFDALNPATNCPEFTFSERVRRFWNLHSDAGFPRRTQRLLAHGLARARHRLFPPDVPARSTDEPTEEESLRLSQIHRKSLQAFQPKPYAGKLTLFRTSIGDEIYKVPEDYGWGPLVGEMDITIVPGHHLTLFDPENVEKLASEVRKRLAAIHV